MSRLLLARHAETVWHGENRYAGGRSEPELTDLGLRQAEQLGKAAVGLGVGVVVSSPQRRAVTTATPAAAALGLPLRLRPDLREVDFGDLEGHTLSEMDPEAVRCFREDPEANRFPNAEPLRSAGERCAAALREVDAEHDGTVLVVAHSSLFRIGLCVLMGLPVARYRHVFPLLENAALTEIRLPADPAEPAALLSLNRLP
ncbi:histidine phosphatase family protein [Actinophytocola glycyrrhizae]|uniref:Histidine phosphatase family protein n=1 Tax=Actinophytocola glycyrrhizae TaxID=2044873 RepID=A0ABV9S209_9PSEU